MESVTQPNQDPSQALAQYQQAIAALNDYLAGNYPSAEDSTEATMAHPVPLVRLVWELLCSRDRLQTALPTNTPKSPPWNRLKDSRKLISPDQNQRHQTIQTAIRQKDHQWRQLANKIQTVVDFATLRLIAQPPPTSWWWFVDLDKQLPWWSQYDWLWNSFAFVSLTAAFNLLLSVANKLLAAGPDALGVLVITQGVLPLLAGGSALTTQGKQTIQQTLAHLRIPQYLWAEVSSLLSLGVFLIALGLRSSVSIFSDYYHNAGYEDYQKGQLNAAEENFIRAIKLDNNNFPANYQLGKLYQDLQDNEQALANYKIALKGGISQAYDDIIGIYLANKQYAEADNWLWQQVRPKNNPANPSQVLTQKQYQALTILVRVYLQRGSYAEAIRWIDMGIRQTQNNATRRYTLLTYLGWVRLLQSDRESEAATYLQTAIDLDLQQVSQSQYKISQLQQQHPQINFRRLQHQPQPTAYCLMAQVQQKQGNLQQERSSWEQCLAWASQTNPDEDNWISLARKRLKVIDNAP